MTLASDIEIYIDRLTAEDLRAWLADQLDALHPQRKRRGMPKNAVLFEGEWRGDRFTVLVMEQVMDGFTSLWLNSPALPWRDDTECGLAAARHFQREVRIPAGGWQEKDDPDAWTRIGPDGAQTPLQWKTD